MRVITDCNYMSGMNIHLLNVKIKYGGDQTKYYTITLDSLELNTLIVQLKASLECEELHEDNQDR